MSLNAPGAGGHNGQGSTSAEGNPPGRIQRLEERLVLSENLARIQGECIHDLIDVLDPIGMAIQVLQNQSWKLPVEDRLVVRETLAEAEAGMELARMMQQELMSVASPVNGPTERLLIKDTVRQALRLLNRRLKTPIQVYQEIEPDLALVVEPGKLLRLVLNLLRHAFQSLDDRPSGPDRPRLWIEARVESGWPSLVVRDNGPGAHPRDVIGMQSFSTEMLTRVDQPLTICRRFMRDWGGQLDIWCEPGQGCEVRLLFPPPEDARLTAGIEAWTLTPRASGEPGRLSTTSLMEKDPVTKKRILLVDDEREVREAISMLLTLDDHEVTEAADGVGALRIFEPDRFDLVITDLRMPGMSGDQLAVRLRELAPNLPLLMITGFAEGTRGQANPVDLILNKPVYLADLRKGISQVLSESKRN